MSRVLVAVGLSVATLALVLCVIRVWALSGRELDTAIHDDWTSLAERGGANATLVEARLQRDHEVQMELCASGSPASWVGAGQVAVLAGGDATPMFELPLDAALLDRAATSGAGWCVTFGRVASLAIPAEAVDASIQLRLEAAAAAPLLATPVRGRFLQRRPLTDLDILLVLTALAGAFAFVLGIAGKATSGGAGIEAGTSGALPAALGVALVVSIQLGLEMLPAGSLGGFAGGLTLAAAEVLVAAILVRRASGTRTEALALGRPIRRAWPWLLAAPFLGVALARLATTLIATIPRTGVAPIEAYVSWPSGMLAFATLAVVAPIAEEVFFRGFVFGALRGNGGTARTVAAVVGAWALFVLAHVRQDYGNWGGLLSVAVAGLGFTLLRAASGSLVIPCLAHLAYNAPLALSMLVAGAR